jgi:hypothetical protein
MNSARVIDRILSKPGVSLGNNPKRVGQGPAYLPADPCPRRRKTHPPLRSAPCFFQPEAAEKILLLLTEKNNESYGKKTSPNFYLLFE